MTWRLLAITALITGMFSLNVAQADDSRAATQPSAAPQPKAVAIFARLIGTWRGDAYWSNGEQLRTRVVYEYGVGGQLLKARSFVVNDKGEAKLVFETFSYLHPRDNALRFVSVSNAGGVYDGTIDGTRDEIRFQWSAFLQDRKTDYKQTLKLNGNDAYQWTVWQKLADGSWKQIIDAELKRESSAAAAASAERP